MDFLKIITIALQITYVFTRKSRSKHHDSSSSEDSIENLLYFKDCQRKKDQEPQPVPLMNIPAPTVPPPPPTPKNECPFPRMCCAMTCGNQCGGQPNSPFLNNKQTDPMHLIGRQGLEPFQPQMKPLEPTRNMFPAQPQIRKRKKMKFPTPGSMQLPINTRRNLGSAKDLIKNMINQDPDIKNILKDLVRVTMQKVNSKYNEDGLLLSSSTTSAPVEEDYDEFID